MGLWLAMLRMLLNCGLDLDGEAESPARRAASSDSTTDAMAMVARSRGRLKGLGTIC